MKRSTLYTIAFLLALTAFLAWSTLSAQRVSCRVCVAFNGQQNCATASHENAVEAARAAQTTACGPLVHGMNDAIACDRRAPVSQQCQNK